MTDKEKAERDKQIVNDWIDWHQSDLPKTEGVLSHLIPRLIEKYNLTERAIYYIVRDNCDAILDRKKQAQARRICRLWREQSTKEKSNKDIVDLLEQERKEFEGNKIDLRGSLDITMMPYIKIGGETQELNIGEDSAGSPGNVVDSGEVVTNNN